ncbi:MAG TPA: hypothetical protein DEQ34_06255 [Balneolaceae bacterium]|nr:hypothetical protein [Balneolaceae bacterium]
MKINRLLILLSFVLVPMLATAQNWTQDTTFVPAEGDIFSDVHGVAVDGEGKIWVQPYYATETIIATRNGALDTLSTRAIYIYNADGTPNEMSPLLEIEWSDDTPTDTLGVVWLEDHYEGFSGRGIEADQNGDIIISSWTRLYKVDHTTGMGMAKADVPDMCAITETTTDAANNIYVASVCAADTPILKYDSNLENPETLITLTGSFSRDLQVAPDGNTIFWSGYTNGAVFKYTKPDEFSGFNATPDTVLRGMRVESYDIHPVTGYLWVGSGSLNDVPAAPWTPQTWYAFDWTTLEDGVTPTPLDSIHWVPGADVSGGFDQARPRGLDFSADGKTAYVSAFAAAETDVDVQVFTTEQVFTSVEDETAELPSGFKLDQNYPNPFNPTTNINYTVGKSGFVTLKVYDITGREVATLVNATRSAGDYTVTFNASGLSSGLYIYSLESNGVRLTNKMTLLK